MELFDRKLIYIKLVHDPWREVDLGKIGRKVNDEILAGHKSIIQEKLDEYWNRINAYLYNKNIDKIYLDSYYEEKKDDFLKKPKILTMGCIVNLLNKKSALIPTESEEIISKTLEKLFKIKISSRSTEEYIRQRTINILRPRDDYITNKIHETAQYGETNALFIGYKHKVDEVIKIKYNDIKIVYLEDPFLKEISDIIDSCFKEYRDKYR